MRTFGRSFLIAEVICCFLPATLLLIMKVAEVPRQFAFLFENTLHWQGTATLLISVWCGTVGVCVLAIVVSRLFVGSRQIDKPVPILAGALVGISPLIDPTLSVLFSADDIDRLLLFFLLPPLLGTTHILYCSRALLVAGFRNGTRPLIGCGTWIAGAPAACVAGFLFWLQQGIGYDALEARRTHWANHRPAAYVYDFYPAGDLPLESSYPKRIRVHGSKVTGASYTGRPAEGAPAPASAAWTMDQIFDALLEAKQRGATVSVRFDYTTGAVVRALVEKDEPHSLWEIAVVGFHWIDTNAPQQPMPVFISYSK